MKLLRCAVYLAITGMIGFFLGRVMPRKWLKPENGLFRCFAIEKDGAVYEKLGIRKWHKRLPDMSRILPSVMPAKNLSGDYEERLPDMILETCVAEVVHITVSVAGFCCLWIWPGIGGAVVTAVYVLLLNLPFILIQRYNRPRLIRLHQKILSKRAKKEACLCVS